MESLNSVLAQELLSKLKEWGVKLSMTEVHVLEAVRNSEVHTMGSVANRLRVTLGTLTTSVNVLVKKGYVSRYRDDTDRRKVLLELNDSAVEVLKLHDKFHDEMISSLFNDYFFFISGNCFNCQIE